MKDGLGNALLTIGAVAGQAALTIPEARQLVDEHPDRIPHYVRRNKTWFHPDAVAVLRELAAEGKLRVSPTRLRRALGGNRRPATLVGRCLLILTWSQAERIRVAHDGLIILHQDAAPNLVEIEIP